MTFSKSLKKIFYRFVDTNCFVLLAVTTLNSNKNGIFYKHKIEFVWNEFIINSNIRTIYKILSYQSQQSTQFSIQCLSYLLKIEKRSTIAEPTSLKLEL